MSFSKRASISLGSNVGDRAANIAAAIAALNNAGMRVVIQSSLYVTEPRDFSPQQWFLNAVVAVQTALLPLPLLHTLRRIERAMGSRKLVRRGPRLIDLDILFYGSAEIRTQELTVPHPRMAERRFVLVPLLEVARAIPSPSLIHRSSQLLIRCPDRSQIERWHGTSPASGK
jgi:2-amino-4-hydroxy-6-hydroxymethyldihydropteridine diphosphokinase